MNQTDTFISTWEGAIEQLQYHLTEIEYSESSNWVRSLQLSLISISSISPTLSPLSTLSPLYQIYLCDNSTKRLYWYNLQDNSSSWMSHADQEYYLSQDNDTSASSMTEIDSSTIKQRNKTILAKVRRTSVLQSAQYHRMTTQELKDSLSKEE